MENKNLTTQNKQPFAHLQLKGGTRNMAKQKFESQGHSFWESRVECIEADSQAELTAKLNEFYVGKFVVGTQVHRNDFRWTALVYYKVKQE